MLLLWLFISSRGLLTAHNARNLSGRVKAMADGARRITYGMAISQQVSLPISQQDDFRIADDRATCKDHPEAQPQSGIASSSDP